MRPRILSPSNPKAIELSSYHNTSSIKPSTCVWTLGAAGKFHPFVEIMAALIAASPLLRSIMEYRRARMVSAWSITFDLIIWDVLQTTASIFARARLFGISQKRCLCCSLSGRNVSLCLSYSYSMFLASEPLFATWARIYVI